MSPAPREIFLTAAEAADALHVDPEWIAEWERRGALRAIVGAGGVRRYARGDIERLASIPPAEDADEPAEPAERAPATPPLTRTRARRDAMRALHAADVRDQGPELDTLLGRYARELAEGVWRARSELDEVIEGAAENWRVARMPVVDRTVLRIATWELLYSPDVPTGAIVDEAVSLAKAFSTEGSGRFVNGVLGRIARERRPS